MTNFRPFALFRAVSEGGRSHFFSFFLFVVFVILLKCYSCLAFLTSLILNITINIFTIGFYLDFSHGHGILLIMGILEWGVYFSPFPL